MLRCPLEDLSDLLVDHLTLLETWHKGEFEYDGEDFQFRFLWFCSPRFSETTLQVESFKAKWTADDVNIMAELNPHDFGVLVTVTERSTKFEVIKSPVSG
jgi:hypothetical protein